MSLPIKIKIESNNNGNNQFDGSITLFLAMVCMLIVSLILVTLESARISAVKSCVSMAMNQSMDSVLAQYYRPLFEEYHLFGRYQEEERDDLRIKALQQEMLEGTNYVSNPRNGLEGVEGEFYTFLPANIDSLEIGGIEYLGDYENNQLYIQATEAVQYFGLQSIIDKILEGTNLLSDSGKASKAFAMQTEAEEKLAGLEATVLHLMSLIDGISIKEGKVQFHRNGWLECEDDFVKKLIAMPKTMESVKLNQEFIYYSIASNYEDKDQQYTFCIQTLRVISELLEQLLQKEAECNEAYFRVYEVECSIEALNQQNASLYLEKSEKESELAVLEEKPRENMAQIRTLQSEITRLGQQIEETERLQNELLVECSKRQATMQQLDTEYESIKEEEHEMYINAQMRIEEVEAGLFFCREVLWEAIQVIEDAIVKQQEAQGIVLEYEESLEAIINEIPEEMSSILIEELDTMKRAVGIIEPEQESFQLQYDYEAIKETLLFDYDILNTKIQYLSHSAFNDDVDEVERVTNLLRKNQEYLSQYSIENLEFDYSTFNLDQEEENVILNGVHNLVSKGITSLVVEDCEKISDKEIDMSKLPSTFNKINNSQINIGQSPASMSSWDGGMVGDLFTTFSEMFCGEQSIGEGFKDLLDLGFFQTYIHYYFKDYTKEENPSIETVLYPSVLDYEKEYICFRKASDQENLASMIETTFYLRLVLNLLELYSNSGCTQKAQMTATALVSFTGLTFLITVMKLLILMVWAAVEALTDVAAMLQGKSVALFDSRGVHFEYEELLTVSKDQIQQRAKSYDPKGRLAFGYDEYLCVFLLLQSKQSKCYGVMDVIQENLNYRYEGGFLLTRCLSSFKATLHYRIQNVFALGISYGEGLPFEKTLTAGY